MQSMESPAEQNPQPESDFSGVSTTSLLFQLVLVGLAAVLGWMALERATAVWKIWLLKQRPAPTLHQAVDGPGRFQGKLMAPEGRIAPSGQAAAAWALTVLRRDGDSETSVCQLADVSQLWLTDGSAKVPLQIAQTDSRRMDEVAAARLLTEQPPRERIPVPNQVLTACRIADCVDYRVPAPPLEAPRFQPSCTAAYVAEEVRITRGTPVTISGCRSGPIIKDCDDGHDALLRNGLGSIGSVSVNAALWELGLLLLVGLLTASLLYTSPLHELSLALREPTARGSP
ncbi:MAG: hypothetical protein JNM83_26895 [Myxococcales bacterium]|nr:hypothetical protein [Myxococcales bacterium]